MVSIREHGFERTGAPFVLAMALSLAACGGGSDTAQYEEAAALADAKESEARAWGVANPCTAASQCATLAFVSPAVCADVTYKAYSLVSPTAAAAAAAAASQNELAAEARALAASSVVACPARSAAPPALTCTANVCQTVPSRSNVL